MNVVICGAGDVGTHAAEVLASKHNKNVIVIDNNPQRLQHIEDTMDVATIRGNCADAGILKEAGAASADLVIGATSLDEVNLLTAATAKAIGAKHVVARVHHRAFFEERQFDYFTELGIDRLICPEHAAALAIAGTVRNPGALALESFANGAIQMQELIVSEKATGVGKPLGDLSVPGGSRIASVVRGNYAFVPNATTIIEPGDLVVLVANADVFQEARNLFREEDNKRRKMVVMGGPPMAVWLCRALKDRNVSIRLFEENYARAEELASKLDWIKVFNADPTDPMVFEEEHIANCDVFVAIGDRDEKNILSCAWAKNMEVKETVAVVQRSRYVHLLSHVGIDHAFSPRQVAVREMEDLLDQSPISLLANLTEGVVDVYRVRIGPNCDILEKPLREASIKEDCLVVAIPDVNRVRLPGPDDVLHAGDTVIVVGRHKMEPTLEKIFDAR